MDQRIELYLFRHGETDWNAQQRFQGHKDIPLNNTGRTQAKQLVAPLKKLGIEVILSSDLCRAQETAQIIADELALRIFVDSGLREAHLGKAEGLTVSEIEEQFGQELVDRWKSPFLSDADVSYPGGETGTQVLERTIEAMTEFCGKHSFCKIGIATHGGVIRRVVRSLHNDHSQHIPIPNGILYGLGFHPQKKVWKLHSHMPF